MKVTGMWERLPHSIRQQGECETKRTVHPSGAHRQEGAIHHHASLGTASLHTLGSPSCCSESWKTSLRSLSFCAIVYPLLSLFLPLYCFFFFLLFLLTAKWPWEFRDGFLELTRGRIKGNFGMIDPWDQSGVIVQPLCFLLQTRTAFCRLICNSLPGAWVHFVVSESMINQ